LTKEAYINTQKYMKKRKMSESKKQSIKSKYQQENTSKKRKANEFKTIDKRNNHQNENPSTNRQ
jgi:hypothetical protein